MIISNLVRDVLRNAEPDGYRLHIPSRLERNEYLEVAKVLEAAGARWDRKAKAFLFERGPEIAAVRVENLLNDGEIIHAREDLEFFPTPPDVVATLIAQADIQDGHVCLEPSAGQGAIAVAMSRAADDVVVDMIELHKPHVAMLENLHLPQSDIRQGDFLECRPSIQYDRIVMNPPFSRQQDIDHVEHALTFLKPGGRLVSVMSGSLLFSSVKRVAAFRQWLNWWGAKVIPLPEGAFKSSGTMVKTVVVVIDKQE